MLIARTSSTRSTGPTDDGADTPSDPRQIEALFDEVLERMEAKAKEDALRDWRSMGRQASDFERLWADEVKQAGAPAPYRVRVLDFRAPLNDLLIAANPSREDVPPVTNNMLRANVISAVAQHGAGLRAAQGNGHWFLWSVVKIPDSYRVQDQHIAMGRRTEAEGLPARTVWVAQPGMEDEPTQDKVTTKRDRIFVYQLHFIDVTGRGDVGFDGKDIAAGAPKAQGESAVMERFASLVADKLTPKAAEPATATKKP